MVLSSLECRAIDQFAIEEVGFPSLVLMENAGRGCAEWITRQTDSPVVLIGAGAGNNGGDGYVIARHLHILGVPCRVIALGDPQKLTPDARVNYELADWCGIEISTSGEPADWFADVDGHAVNFIVDAMLGTGSLGAPREPFATFICAANQHAGHRIAIDVPTGLDADSGRPAEPAFQAHTTLTFVDTKTGFDKESARGCVGNVVVMNIGIPQDAVQRIERELTTD